MRSFIGPISFALLMAPLAMPAWPSLAQAQEAAKAAARQPDRAASRGARAPQGYRRLVPGVLTTVAPDSEPSETVSYHNLVELLAVPDISWNPLTVTRSATIAAKATNIDFRREVWNLEFSFLPMRMIEVDVPTTEGKMQRTMVWYMVYRVINRGGHLHPVRQEDGTWQIERKDYAVNCVPSFTLFNPESRKSYLDKLVPVAMEPIRRREDPRRRLLSSVEMMQKPLEVTTEAEDNSVWGVAMWESGVEGDQVDPATDYFSVFVAGLSNAYKFADPPGSYKPGSPPASGRLFRQKTLQLNFWRPSDAYLEQESPIYLGTPPAVTGQGQIDYQWVFR